MTSPAHLLEAIHSVTANSLGSCIIGGERTPPWWNFRFQNR